MDPPTAVHDQSAARWTDVTPCQKPKGGPQCPWSVTLGQGSGVALVLVPQLACQEQVRVHIRNLAGAGAVIRLCSGSKSWQGLVSVKLKVPAEVNHSNIDKG